MTEVQRHVGTIIVCITRFVRVCSQAMIEAVHGPTPATKAAAAAAAAEAAAEAAAQAEAEAAKGARDGQASTSGRQQQQQQQQQQHEQENVHNQEQNELEGGAGSNGSMLGKRKLAMCDGVVKGAVRLYRALDGTCMPLHIHVCTSLGGHIQALLPPSSLLCSTAKIADLASPAKELAPLPHLQFPWPHLHNCLPLGLTCKRACPMASPAQELAQSLLVHATMAWWTL
eukprot:scaffold26036_cov21-Tisochrysis_lutea.AAC.3